MNQIKLKNLSKMLILNKYLLPIHINPNPIKTCYKYLKLNSNPPKLNYLLPEFVLLGSGMIEYQKITDLLLFLYMTSIVKGKNLSFLSLKLKSVKFFINC